MRRFPCDPGPAAWNALLPPEPPRAELNDKIAVDWLVIGAGFTGLSAARRLSELHPSDKIAVLDASRVAEGPAGRNSGFMIDVPHDLTSSDYSGSDKLTEQGAQDQIEAREIRLNRAGISYAKDASDSYRMSAEAFNVSGKINGAITAKGAAHNDAYARHLESLSEPYERLDANAMRSLTGSESYIDGLYSPGTAMIQPAMFIRHLAKGIESLQLKIYENTAVQTLRREASNWVADTARGSVVAPKVIMAVNGHLESFGYYQKQLMHIFTYGSMSHALTAQQIKSLGGLSNWALTPADPLGTTVRRVSGTGGDRIIIRNRATFDPTLSVNDKRIAHVARTHDQSFRDRFPMLREVRSQYRWGGRLCLSRNNVPVFGEIDQNLFAACCQNGLGTAKGMVSGMLAAELASEISSPLLDDQCAYASPTRLPVRPIATIGANIILRWGEWRAGKEL